MADGVYCLIIYVQIPQESLNWSYESLQMQTKENIYLFIYFTISSNQKKKKKMKTRYKSLLCIFWQIMLLLEITL